MFERSIHLCRSRRVNIALSGLREKEGGGGVMILVKRNALDTMELAYE